MSYLLDTNVVSEAFRPRRNVEVEGWFERTPRNRIFVSSVTKAELLFGLAIMPSGRRQLQLSEAMYKFLSRELRTEILPFGTREAELYAEIGSHRRALGRPISQFDAQIAAIARSHGFAVVTRNVADFEDCGIEVINPREAHA